MHRRRPVAIIFVPRAADSARWWKVCVEYCQDCGYNVVSVVARWEDVQRVIELDHIEVVVAARRDHFPPDRTPREEVVAEARPKGQIVRQRQERTSRTQEDRQ